MNVSWDRPPEIGGREIRYGKYAEYNLGEFVGPPGQ
jgi:hypothetical protein